MNVQLSKSQSDQEIRFVYIVNHFCRKFTTGEIYMASVKRYNYLFE